MSKGAAAHHKHATGLRRGPITVSVVSLLLTLLGSGCGVSINTPPAPTPLFPQTKLDGTCFPKFAVNLPVFGPAGSIPRVDAVAHPNLTVTMMEINQTVLPQGSFAPCGAGVTLGQTRVWAYQTTDSNTNAVLGPAHWPAVTLVAQRNTATRVQFVNQLPSFNPSNPSGPGLVQGELPSDQTLHWADPLQTGCGMQTMQMQRSQMAGVSDQDKQKDFADPKPPEYDGKKRSQEAHIQLASYPMPSSTGSSEGSPRPSSVQSSTASDPCRQQYIGPVPATVHLHGAEIPAAYDGDPESWFTPNGLKGADYETIGNPGPGKAIYEYPNSQEAGTLWFHDHALGITRLNVYAGLAGFYFLKDPDKEPQGFPSGAYEIEMAIQDRMFDTNGQLYLLNQQTSFNHPFWAPGFEGDVATVNGAAFPYLNVEPRRYRFHLLNGSINRGFQLVFGNLPVYLVGADDNYFDRPVPADPTGVPLSPGERVDIIVDFTNFAGQNVELTNSRPGQYVKLSDIMLFKVASAPPSPSDTSCDPANPDMSTGTCARKYPMVHLTDGKGNVAPGVKIDKVRQLVLYDYIQPVPSGTPNPNKDPQDIIEYVNGTNWDGLRSAGIAQDFPNDGVSELPREGSIEEWDIVYLSNMAMASHPVHLHLSQFQVLNRQNINIGDAKNPGYLAAWNAAYGTNTKVPWPTTCPKGSYCNGYGPPLDYSTLNADGALGGNPAFTPYIPTDCLTNPADCPMPPRASESGWKDTADADADQVLRILVRWTPSDIPLTPNQSNAGQNFYAFDPTQGYYVWHCHVITHEDNEMMRPYRVTK